MITTQSLMLSLSLLCFFFFNDTATTEIYTLSLHDALPISATSQGSPPSWRTRDDSRVPRSTSREPHGGARWHRPRSEEHTSELQSPCNLVCRLLLEKKKTTTYSHHPSAPPRQPLVTRYTSD